MVRRGIERISQTTDLFCVRNDGTEADWNETHQNDDWWQTVHCKEDLDHVKTKTSCHFPWKDTEWQEERVVVFTFQIVEEISADFHGKTADLDERMPVTMGMVVAMETPVDFGYGPHLRYALLLGCGHIQNEQQLQDVQLCQVCCFHPDLQYFHEIFLD